MSITLIVMTDGRSGYLSRAIDSMHHLHGTITRRVLHDDTGDVDHRSDLRRTYPDWEIRGTVRRSGFAGAYGNAWEWLTHCDDSEFVFSTEDDFEFIRPVDLDAMCRVLADRAHLTQLALRRQSWNAEERDAGGIVERDPDAYTEVRHGAATWLEHRRFHTTNPSLMRRGFIAAHRWPQGQHSEGRFAVDLFRSDPAARAGYWGAKDSGIWCEHIGDIRAGYGY